MSGYLPLCAFREGLLPPACLSCAWWQTRGDEALPPDAAAAERRRWMIAVESTWGTTGLLLEGNGTPVVGSIQFAPVSAVPRLHDLPFGGLPEGSALVFCLTGSESRPRYQLGRILHKALGRLRARGVEEVYAVASETAGPGESTTGVCPALGGSRCRFFAPDLLSANGFEQLVECRDLTLMCVDLRGLLALVAQIQTAVRRALGHEPAPSPAAWARRHTT
jgi:hypothetical protein